MSSKLFFLVYRIVIFFLILGCTTVSKRSETEKTLNPENIIVHLPKDSSQSSQVSTPKSSKVTKKEKEKAPFTLTNANLRSFLTKYGSENPETKVKITTAFGDIVIQLFTKTALHRANFVYLTKQGYFDETFFYRVAKDFVIQGGNSDRYEMSKKRREIGKYTLPQELYPDLKHRRSMVALSKQWVDNPSNRSTPFEFFIVVAHSGAHHLDGEHTVFGRVIRGMDVADRISKVDVDQSEWPKKNIRIRAVVIP